MKKIVLATLCFLMATGVFAQNKKSATPPQKSVTTEQDSTWIKIYRQASISSIKIKLSSDLEDNDVFKKVEEFYKNEVITDKTLEASRKGIVHIANALSMNSKINAIKDEISPFAGNYKGGSIICFGGIGYSYNLNTNQFDGPRSGVDYVLRNIVMPFVYSDVEVDSFACNYICFNVSFGMKDFTDKYSIGEGLTVTTIVPMKDMNQLKAGKISEEEFSKKCDFFYMRFGYSFLIKFEYDPSIISK